MVNWNELIEAVEKATGRVVPMTFRKAEGYFGEKVDHYMTTESPDTGNSNELWHEDGRSYCHTDAWFIRNVPAKTFRVRELQENGDIYSEAFFTTLDEAKAKVLDEARYNSVHDIEGYTFEIAELRPAYVALPFMLEMEPRIIMG